MKASENGSQGDPLDGRRRLRLAREFLEALRDNPFVAIVVLDGEVKVFRRSMEPDDAEQVIELIRGLSA